MCCDGDWVGLYSGAHVPRVGERVQHEYLVEVGELADYAFRDGPRIDESHVDGSEHPFVWAREEFGQIGVSRPQPFEGLVNALDLVVRQGPPDMVPVLPVVQAENVEDRIEEGSIAFPDTVTVPGRPVAVWDPEAAPPVAPPAAATARIVGRGRGPGLLSQRLVTGFCTPERIPVARRTVLVADEYLATEVPKPIARR